MPKISDQNKLYHRGGNVNQHLSDGEMKLTEEEKANISSCRGIKDKHPCKNPVYRCSNCGNYGCNQQVLDKCSQQGFVHGKCMQCGAVNTQIPIGKDEYKNMPDKE